MPEKLIAKDTNLVLAQKQEELGHWLQAAQIYEEKGFSWQAADMYIRAAEELEEQANSPELIFMGGLSKQYQKESEKLRNKALELLQSQA